MGSLFFSEARRITGQCLWKFFFRQDFIDKFTNHGMLTGSNEIQIFSFDFVHHSIHLIKTHYASYHIATNHKRWNAICESTINHKISCIGNHSGVQSCDISHEIIKSVSSHITSSIQINSVKFFHNFCMIRNFKIRHNRLTISLNLHIFTVIFSNRHTRVNDIGNRHHDFFDFCCQFSLFFLQFSKTLGSLCHFCFQSFCFFFFSLSHQPTNIFGYFLSFCTQFICFLLSLTALFIQLNHFVHKRNFPVLKFIFDILFYNIGIFP